MKIAIDVSPVVYGTGVSVYTKNLVNNLTKIDKENEYLLFGGSLRQFKKLNSAFSGINTKYYRMPPLAMHYLFNHTNLPINLFTGKINLFHASDWTHPAAKCPTVTTVHDLSPLKFPQYTPSKIVATHKIRLKRAKKFANKIIAVSQSTKKDLIELGFDEAKIEVVYEAAVPLPKFSKEQEKKILQKFNLQQGRFLLNVGTNPRKNNNNIAQAFAKLNKKGIVEKFVVTGNKPQKPMGNIDYLGFVSDIELAVLYKNAACLVYASLYEGFGIPVLQAFQIGCPVVTSNISSLPEVAGNAAVLVNPKEPEDIATGIIKVLSNKSELVKKGLLQAKKFSWQRCAKETLEIYNFFN